MARFLLIFLFSVSAALPTFAQNAAAPDVAPKEYVFPLECALGTDCHVLAYVDMDAAQGAQTDYKCQPRSDDDNKGTDFAVANMSAMENGVDVLAAADGTVFRMRDGEDDSLKDEDALADVKSRNRDCGNGIVLNHAGGAQTIYCHLKEGSISIDQDQRVSKGQKIAELGNSGFSKMPHLHFGVVNNGAVIEPFSGLSSTDKCGALPKTSLWEDTNITYQEFGIFDAGFRTSLPDFDAIKQGENNPKTLPKGAQALTFWAGYFGALEGDKIHFKILDPNGNLMIERTYTQKENAPRQYYYTGRKITGGILKIGNYVGTVTIKRGQNSQTITRILNIIE